MHDERIAQRETPDASGLQLSSVNLDGVDLAELWMPRGSFTIAAMSRVRFQDANLQSVSFVRCTLTGACFINADLRFATFGNSGLANADFAGSDLTGARFNVCGVNGSNPGNARTLRGAQFRNVRDLSDEQRRMCVEKGATVEDDVPVAVTQTLRQWHELNAYLLGTRQYELSDLVQAQVLADWEHIDDIDRDGNFESQILTSVEKAERFEAQIEAARAAEG